MGGEEAEEADEEDWVGVGRLGDFGDCDGLRDEFEEI